MSSRASARVTLVVALSSAFPIAHGHKLFHSEWIGCNPIGERAYLVTWEYHSSDGPYFSLQRASINTGPWTTISQTQSWIACYGPVTNYRWYQLKDCEDGYLTGFCYTSDTVWVPIVKPCSGPP
jgi:hypothetical protein